MPGPGFSTRRVVVASPTDVQPERDALPAIIEDINHDLQVARTSISLELDRWEDIGPGLHREGPQGLADDLLRIPASDLVVVILWKTLGTPLPDGRTGTQHELDLAYASWKQTGKPDVALYFCQRCYTPESKRETDNWGRVLEFRGWVKEHMPELSYEGYDSLDYFRKRIRDRLWKFAFSEATNKD